MVKDLSNRWTYRKFITKLAAIRFQQGLDGKCKRTRDADCEGGQVTGDVYDGEWCAGARHGCQTPTP